VNSPAKAPGSPVQRVLGVGRCSCTSESYPQPSWARTAFWAIVAFGAHPFMTWLILPKIWPVLGGLEFAVVAMSMLVVWIAYLDRLARR
jgi:hypothetical protein